MLALKKSSSKRHDSLVGAAAFLSIAFLTVAHPAQAQLNLTKELTSDKPGTDSWSVPYDQSMAQIYQSSLNQLTQQAIQNSQLFVTTTMRHTRTLTKGPKRLSPREQRLTQMSQADKDEAAKFARYTGTMFQETSPPLMPARLAATFAKMEGDSSDQAHLARTFSRMLAVYKQHAQEQGAPPNDLARSIAYCVATNYFYFSDGTTVSEPELTAFRGNLRTALSENARFRKLSDIQKQQMSETMIILASFVAYGLDDIAPKTPIAKRNAVRQAFRKLAGTNLQGLLGVDPTLVSFKDDGLAIARPKRVSDLN